MNKTNETITPKLRFRQFQDCPAWRIDELGTVTKPVEKRAGAKKYTLMSVTSGVGLIPQTEKFGREIAGSAYKNYYVIKKNDFAYNRSATKQFPEGYISMLKGYEEAALPNSIFTCFRVIDKECDPRFFDHLFQSNYHGSWLRKYIEVGARAHGSLSFDTQHLWDMPVALPNLKEQQKIADCLASIDGLIVAENKKLETLKTHKTGLMQKLFPVEGKTVPEWRFPVFRGSGEWIKNSVGELITTITPPKKFLTSDYEKEGEFPIIDQSQEDVCGWTNDQDALVSGKFPLLVFGDHTCILKMAHQPFAQGADGIKIFSSKSCIEPRFLYQYLLFAPIKADSYSRHFSDLKERIIVYPKKESGEQQKISECLLSLDSLIKTQKGRVEFLKLFKKGLLLGLFPSFQEMSV